MPTAKGWGAADIRRLTGPGATGPWLTLTVVVPVATKGTLNSREHWAARARRVKGERTAVAAVLLMVGPPPRVLTATPRVRVTLTRVNGGTMDDDNLKGALKGVRDEVASGWFKRDDADPRFEWVYAQEPGRGPAAVRITFEVGV